MVLLSRFVSLLRDYHTKANGYRAKKKQVDGVVLSERERINIPCGQDDYSLFNYLAYALYSPLYLAGPIITYNDFIAQVSFFSYSLLSLPLT
jgi:protein-cysteine N-palmitoyltransferase HHAT